MRCGASPSTRQVTVYSPTRHRARQSRDVGRSHVVRNDHAAAPSDDAASVSAFASNLVVAFSVVIRQSWDESFC